MANRDNQLYFKFKDYNDLIMQDFYRTAVLKLQ